MTWVVVCFVWTLIAGALYWGLHELQLAKARLQHVASLRSKLKSGHATSLDSATYRSLSEIERGQIARARADSIRQFEPDEVPTAIVQKE